LTYLYPLPKAFMQNFIVSARKYRPQTFDTVVGQRSITSTLKNAIRNNQLAQAFLFCGPRGIGKTTCARILAKTINCEHISENGEACDQCVSCTSFNENASFNIYELDGASNNSVEDIRNLVDQVRIPPQVGRYKVYIIDEVHMLSASAFNAFLKTLEEPPAYAKFILATTEKHKIIPTILSRCQIFDFRRITVDDIAGHLKHVAEMEHVNAEEDALHVIAQKADGAMRDALSIFDQLVSFAGDTLTYTTVLENLNVLDYDYFFRITGQVLEGDIAGTMLTINEIIDKGFDGQHFLTGFGEHLRNLLVCKDPSTVRLLETAPNIRQRYLDQATACDAGWLLKILDISNRCDLNYKISNNKRLHLELALMQMCITGNPSEYVRPVPKREPESQPLPKKPVPPATAPPAKPVSVIKDLPGSISIRKNKTEEPAKESAAGQADEPSGEQPFTQQELEIQWDLYTETLKSGLPHLYSMLKARQPKLSANNAIEFTVDNKILADEFNQKRGELTDFLRKSLNNYKIELKARIVENHNDLKPYTDKEKYERMVEKNPALNNLREQLDLDIEY
jgi:DNA polymerase III subunit gamma/tau